MGPYVVERQVNDTDYIISTPDRRRKTHLCDAHMLKRFHPRGSTVGEGSMAPVGVSLVTEPIQPDDGLVECSAG